MKDDGSNNIGRRSVEKINCVLRRVIGANTRTRKEEKRSSADVKNIRKKKRINFRS